MSLNTFMMVSILVDGFSRSASRWIQPLSPTCLELSPSFPSPSSCWLSSLAFFFSGEIPCGRQLAYRYPFGPLLHLHHIPCCHDCRFCLFSLSSLFRGPHTSMWLFSDFCELACTSPRHFVDPMCRLPGVQFGPWDGSGLFVVPTSLCGLSIP